MRVETIRKSKALSNLAKGDDRGLEGDQSLSKLKSGNSKRTGKSQGCKEGSVKVVRNREGDKSDVSGGDNKTGPA